MQRAQRGKGKVTFPSYPPPEGKVWYTTTEGLTIPVTAAQREIALQNLDEQGVARPMQYDDPGVEVTQLVQTEPDERQKAAAAMAQRAPGKYFVLRFILGAALVALSLHVSLVVRSTTAKIDGFQHLDTTEGMAAVFAAAAYIVISCARYSDDGGVLGLLTALSGVIVLGLELTFKNNQALLGVGIGLVVIVSFADLIGWCSAPRALPPLKLDATLSNATGSGGDGHSPMSPV